MYIYICSMSNEFKKFKTFKELQKYLSKISPYFLKEFKVKDIKKFNKCCYWQKIIKLNRKK